MIVRVSDIPSEGLSLNLEIEAKKISDRIDGKDGLSPEDNILKHTPKHIFTNPVSISMKLSSDGQTVEMKGSYKGVYLTNCSRCAEETEKNLASDFHLFIKPKKGADDDEDIDFAFYEGQDIECTSYVEDVIVLNVPFFDLCGRDCKGLCRTCGINLNHKDCKCENLNNFESDDLSSNPLKALKNIKILN